MLDSTFSRRFCFLAASLPTVLLVAIISGCGGKDEVVTPVQPPATVVEEPDPTGPPPGKKLLSQGEQVEHFETGSRGVRSRANVQFYEGNITVNHGRYDAFWSDGRRAVSGEYQLGKKVGPWKYFHKNGEPAKTEEYVAGKLQGRWTQYRENGTKEMDLEYAANQKTGVWTKFDAAGVNPVERNDYAADQLIASRTYYPNGKVKSEKHFKNGELEGIAIEFYTNGNKKREQEYHDGKLDGKETYYDEKDGKAFTRVFSKGHLRNP